MIDGKNLRSLIWVPVFIVFLFYLAGIVLWFFDVLIVSWRIVFLWPWYILLVWLTVQGFKGVTDYE